MFNFDFGFVYCRQTDRQTNRSYKNITSLVELLMIVDTMSINVLFVLQRVNWKRIVADDFHCHGYVIYVSHC